MNIKFIRNNQEIGVYPSEDVPGLLRSNILHKTDYYYHEGMKDWRVIGNRWSDIAQPVDPIAELEASAIRRLPERRSGWAGFFRFMAILAFGLGVMGTLAAILMEAFEAAGFYFALGSAGTIQLLFMAFLVDVLTDIR